MSVSEFVDQWLGDSMPEGCNASTPIVGGKPLLYLKDWHFVKVRVGVTFISLILYLTDISFIMLPYTGIYSTCTNSIWPHITMTQI